MLTKKKIVFHLKNSKPVIITDTDSIKNITKNLTNMLSHDGIVSLKTTQDVIILNPANISLIQIENKEEIVLDNLTIEEAVEEIKPEVKLEDIALDEVEEIEEDNPEVKEWEFLAKEDVVEEPEPSPLAPEVETPVEQLELKYEGKPNDFKVEFLETEDEKVEELENLIEENA